jgi:hypothetical protein
MGAFITLMFDSYQIVVDSNKPVILYSIKDLAILILTGLAYPVLFWLIQCLS